MGIEEDRAGSNLFKEWLTAIVAGQGLTMTDLADGVGVTQPTISRWLSGEDTPSSQSCRKLAAYLNISERPVLILAGHVTEEEVDPTMTDPFILLALRALKELSPEGRSSVESFIRWTLQQRHSTATLLLSLGIPAKIISEILGHSNIGITMDTYVGRVTPAFQEEAMSKLNTLLTQQK